MLQQGESGPPEKKKLRTDNTEEGDVPELQSFAAWLKQEGAARENLIFTQTSGSGRGTTARHDIHAGEEIASIPIKLVLTTKVARQSSLVKAASSIVDRVLRECEEQPVDDLSLRKEDRSKIFLTKGRVLLCLFMIHQKYVKIDQTEGDQEANGSFSWRPYLLSLPATYRTPLWWSPDELDWLKGTNLAHAVEDRKALLQRAIGDTLLPELCKIHPDLFPASYFKLQNFVWAYTACSSRSFPSHILCADKSAPIPSEEEFDECLLPCLDMLNHQYRKKISWVVNPQTGRLQFVTEEDVHRGSEVFNNYGPKGNEELLLGYGFCIPDNPQDSFMVKTTLPASDPLASLKKDLLDFYGIPNVHPLNAHPNPSVFSALRVAVMNEVELYFHDRVQPVPPSTKEVIPMQNLRNELEMLKMLRSLISYKLQQLSAIGFEGVEREDMPTENIANAITYLQGQKKALLACLQLTFEMQQDIAARQQPSSLAKGVEPEGLYSNCPLWLSKDKKIQWKMSVKPLQPFLDQSFSSFLAAEKLSRGGVAVSLPLKYLITADVAAGSPSFGPILEMVEGLDDEETVLILYIMHERAKGKKSKWNGFLSELPTEFNSTPFWSEKEMELVSCGRTNTELHLLTESRKQEFKALYGQLFPSLSAALPQFFPENAHRFSDFLWAITLVRTRSFEIVVDGAPMTCVLPLHRIPRHHPFVPTQVGFDPHTRSFNITTLVDMERGDELFIQYPGASGANNDQLLCQFGYVPCRGENEFFNTIPLTIPRDAFDEKKILFMRERKMSLSHLLRGTGELSPKLTQTLAMYVQTEEEFLRMIESAKTQQDHGDIITKEKMAEALRELLSQQHEVNSVSAEKEEGTLSPPLRVALAAEYMDRKREVIAHVLSKLC